LLFSLLSFLSLLLSLLSSLAACLVVSDAASVPVPVKLEGPLL